MVRFPRPVGERCRPPFRAPLWLALAVSGLYACRDPRIGDLRSSLRGEEYLRNTATRSHSIAVRYTPPMHRLLSDRRLRDDARLDEAVLDSLERAVGPDGGIGFLLRIEPSDSAPGPGFDQDLVHGTGNGFGNYREALAGLRFGLKERIWLEVDGRKVPLADYRMEDSFGLSRGRTFVLAFPSLESIGAAGRTGITLVLDDIVPGLSRQRLDWDLPVGKYDEPI